MTVSICACSASGRANAANPVRSSGLASAGQRPVSVRHALSSSNVLPSPLSPVSSVVRRPGLSAISPAGPMFVTRMCLSTLWNLSMGS